MLHLKQGTVLATNATGLSTGSTLACSSLTCLAIADLGYELPLWSPRLER